jgi:hypothetical protein
MATYHQLGALDQHKPNSTPRHILVSTRSKHDTRYMEKRRCHNKKIPGLPGSSRVKTRPALEKWVDPVPGLQVKRIAWSWTWLSNPGRHRMAQKRDFGTITYCIRPENNVSNSSEISWFDMYSIYVYIYMILKYVYIYDIILYVYIYILYYMYNTKRMRAYTTMSYWDDFVMIQSWFHQIQQKNRLTTAGWASGAARLYRFHWEVPPCRGFHGEDHWTDKNTPWPMGLMASKECVASM